jgi:hypothetical protein
MFPITYFIVICQKLSPFACVNIYEANNKQDNRNKKSAISPITNTSLCKDNINLKRIRHFSIQERNPSESANHTL